MMLVVSVLTFDGSFDSQLLLLPVLPSLIAICVVTDTSLKRAPLAITVLVGEAVRLAMTSAI